MREGPMPCVKTRIVVICLKHYRPVFILGSYVYFCVSIPAKSLISIARSLTKLHLTHCCVHLQSWTRTLWRSRLRSFKTGKRLWGLDTSNTEMRISHKRRQVHAVAVDGPSYNKPWDCLRWCLGADVGGHFRRQIEDKCRERDYVVLLPATEETISMESIIVSITTVG